MFPIRDTLPGRHASFGIWLLVLVNAVVFYGEIRLSHAELEQILFAYGLVPARYLHPVWAADVGFPTSYWPFLTSLFLHGGWLHIILNMWMLWIFGNNVEDRMGFLRFLCFYLLCGVISLVAHSWANPHSHIPAVGASGAISGVLGAYLIMYPLARIIAVVPILFYPVFIEIPAFIFLTLWFVLQIASGAMIPASVADNGGVAWWAHIGGFVAGMLLWPLFLHPRRRRRRVSAEAVGIDDSWIRRR